MRRDSGAEKPHKKAKVKPRSAPPKARPRRGPSPATADGRLAEALEQQAATAEILRVIRSSPADVQPVFDVIAERAMRLCGGLHGGVMRFDGELVQLAAHVAVNPDFSEALNRLYPTRPVRSMAGARAILTRSIVLIPDVEKDPDYAFSEQARAVGFRSALAVPMLREGEAIGSIVVFRGDAAPFSERHVALLQAFADQAVIAIENTRLFTELESRNRALAEALDQQTVTGEILRVISSSPIDIQPVFDIIAESAVRLCGAEVSTVTRLDGDLVHLDAIHGFDEAGIEIVRRAFPMRPGGAGGAARAIHERAIVHIPDILTDPEYRIQEAASAAGLRALLSVPMFRDGRVIGAITVGRSTPGRFSDAQVQLLRTFAEQTIIAIENGRLFSTLEERNAQLGEALEQQTATGEILRAISRSPTDIAPVLETVVRAAARFCSAPDVAILRLDGAVFRGAAAVGPFGRELASRAGQIETLEYPVTRGSVTGRAVLESRTVHIQDLAAEPEDEFPVGRELQRRFGHRSMLATPLLREGTPLGVIALFRTEVRPFSDKQVGLLQIFADQAAIAIENVRLFSELQHRNQALTETLEQQTATGEILRVISGSPTDVRPVFETITRNARALCASDSAAVFTYDGRLIDMECIDNASPEQAAALRAAYPMPATHGTATGRALRSGRTTHIPDVREDPDYALDFLRDTVALRTLLAVPMIREGTPIGAITVQRWGSPRPFSDNQIALLQTFADQAVIAIRNVRLFTEVQERNRALGESLEQQTATADILRAISSSPTDIQPVFDIIGERAEQLCDAAISMVSRFDGALIHLIALHGVTGPAAEVVRHAFPMRTDEETLSARAVRSRAVAHLADVLTDPLYATKGAARAGGYRAALAVPMIREGQVVGVIFVARTRPGPFTDSQVELLKTFADQAVIAVENVRLFTELGERNRDLTDALEQQTATSEVLRVMSGSPTDVAPVFDAIVRSAVRLCRARFALVYRLEDDVIRFVAHHNLPAEAVVQFQGTFPQRLSEGGTLVARAILGGEVVNVPDVAADSQVPESVRQLARSSGYRSVMAMPMMSEGRALGALAICRSDSTGEPWPFSTDEIPLLQTFTDQAGIAIGNMSLFEELGVRNRDLSEALAQQTATSEVLKVISRSTFDLQPVLETLIENAARLCHADGGVIYKADGDLHRLAASYNVSADLLEFIAQHPLRPGPGTAVGRAMLESRVVHISDVLADPGYTYGGADLGGYRTILGVPMLREGVPIGVFAVWRREVRPFTDKQIELTTTFADQGAIAIENVRLFSELESRTQELTRSVGELRALNEVSQAVGSTLDLETVLATIVSRAVQLSGSHQGIAYEFDEPTQSFHMRAAHQMGPELLEVLRASPIRLGQGAIGQAGVSRTTVEISDIADERQLVAPQARAVLLREGMGSLLAVPLVREDRVLGALAIGRRDRGAFSPETVAVLQTFATQSVLAIHNARLFREIQRQKQYADALVETSPVAIVTMDLQGAVVGWNPAAERLFGYSQAEAIGQGIHDLVATPELREEVLANVRRIKSGERIHTITRRARKDGTLIDVETATMPIVVDGTEVGLIVIYHDITELLQARREAEAANEAKSSFLATMSHEIRTPMNAVIGMSGLLLNTALGEEQREYAEVIRQSGDALLTVINDILDFSKIEVGRLELESQPFDLRECAEGALDLVATRAAEKGIDLAYLIGDGTPAGIVGDVTRLRQILLNLLSNAVKFTERGEVVLSVTTRSRPEAAPFQEITFSVRDTGIGIPPDRLGRLFQSFSQIDASTTRRYGGTGLGLAISQRLAELMGGRIEVTSEVGRGSDFHFTIRATEAPALPARRDLSGVQPSLRGKRVLVVDDNATNRRILTTHLDTWGMPARATESPREALEWIRAGAGFDIGILDMHMPEMDGVALARALREHPAGATLPLILFTSLGRREALGAEGETFAGYLHKPIKPSQLFDALVSVLAEQPVHVAPRPAARTELDPDLARRHPLRILLAEDNVVNQKLALRLLGQMGYRADLAGNGLEAVDAVARQTYDLVLMDVQMPEMDGLEASREISRRWPGSRPRIVAMTANAMQGDRELCEAAGMDDYVAKPIRVEELIGALERCRPARAAGAQRSPGAAAGPDETPEVDRATVEALAASMGSEFVAELIDTFGQDARELIATLRTALAARDVDALRRAAHSLKSTSESLGAVRLAGLARELESAARAGSLEGAGGRIEVLANRYERVTRALGEIRRELPS